MSKNCKKCAELEAMLNYADEQLKDVIHTLIGSWTRTLHKNNKIGK